ncbi:tyrosinase family oxidase copper chaperone [Streptomyces sp. NPDC056909]|uniref:tyrosinase family oxidase copper chaperone n=1 Tax=Streptomyces sp. NPDC056909 TaxID=3345963 RepID=UPI0036A0D37C
MPVGAAAGLRTPAYRSERPHTDERRSLVPDDQMEPRPVHVPRPEPPAPPGPRRSRRRLLRAVFALGVVAGTSAVLTPILRVGHRAAGGAGGGADMDGAGGGEAGAGRTADEMYRGRHIRIGTTGGVRAPSDAGFLAVPSVLDVRIDGRPLQMMRRADGSYLSVVNHYESFPTPLDAARAAVDDLAGASLSLSGPIHHM